MRTTTKTCILAAATGTAALGFYMTQSGDVAAADHNDPVRVQASGPYFPGGVAEEHPGDPAGDLADIFVWHTGSGPDDKLVTTLTWRTDPMAPRLDPNLVYGIHIDNDTDLKDSADAHIWVRYSADGSGQLVEMQGLEGIDGTFDDASPVGQPHVVEGTDIRLMTGLFDDPFAFDLDGFFNGLSVALGNEAPVESTSLAEKVDQREEGLIDTIETKRPFGFDNRNDSFAGLNVGAFIIELPLSRIADGPDTELHVWATSRALPGRCIRDEECSSGACDSETGLCENAEPSP